MDINRIALYLAGKLPPYYRAPFDKLELIELVRANSVNAFTDDFFKLIDSQDFYSMVLNRLERADKNALVQVLKVLNLTQDAGGLLKNDLIKDHLAILKKEYLDMDKMQNVQDRGYKFEEWLHKLFDVFDLEPQSSYRTELDQIDGSFVLDGREYLLEAKWTTKPTDTSVGDRLFGRLSRSLAGTIGVLITKSGITKNASIARGAYNNILIISGKEIQAVLDQEITLIDLIRKIRRKGADMGETYLE